MRQHVVWFQQFMDASAFSSDAIANYFRSVAPLGVTTVYWLGAKAGIAPLVLAKLLPLTLALIATGFLFFTTLEIVSVPLAAWLSTLMFNQHLWLNDDLVSATPRAFVYPLFTAFLYFVVKRSLLPMLVAIALLGLFFPQMMLVAVAVLIVRLIHWRDTGLSNPQSPHARLRLMTNGQQIRFVLLGVLVAALVVLPFVLNLSDYGDAVMAEQMRSQLEYQAGGRNPYFGVHPVSFILYGSSGLRIPVFPSIIWIGFALPFLMRRKRHWKSPTLRAITPQIRLLWDLTIASFGLFFAAHVLLLRLHFPSRYLYHSWRFILSIAAGIVLAALVEQGWEWWQRKRLAGGYVLRSCLVKMQGFERFRFPTLNEWSKKEIASVSLISLITVVVVGVPLLPPLMVAFQGWVVGEAPAIYQYLATQPADTMVASLSAEANNIPVFAQRSTWVGREFALPHHPQYYAVVRDRTADLLTAQYSSDLNDLRDFVDRTGVDFLLIDRTAFIADYLRQDWLLQSSLQAQVQAIMARLEDGEEMAIAPRLPHCTVVSTEHHLLVNADCL